MIIIIIQKWKKKMRNICKKVHLNLIKNNVKLNLEYMYNFCTKIIIESNIDFFNLTFKELENIFEQAYLMEIKLDEEEGEEESNK